MSTQKSEPASWLEQLTTHLRAERYSASVQRRYPQIAQHFLTYIERLDISIETVRSPDIEEFLRRRLRLFRKQHGRAPLHLRRWRCHYTKLIHIVLRLVHGQWPVASAPATELEAFHRSVVHGYDTWMRELRGLAAVTRSERTTQALQFLTALSSCGDPDGLMRLNVSDVDAYVQRRFVGLRRRSIKDYTGNLRVFLRYLYGSARTALDLSRTVIGPRIYTDEDIPSALRPEEVERVLAATCRDRSPTGRRDYAILMLLASYGLRAGEIIRLRLDDIDWKHEVLHVRHSKTGAHSELPLLRTPGEAILNYLQKARPKSTHRELFLRVRAPYRAFKSGTSLCSVVRARLTAAGVFPQGKSGPHAFRHARAMSLLRASVPIKTLGDVLGHRSSRSTGVYLKLATEDLRAVCLDVPSGVSP
jgi:integrase/recombinase XerD